MTIAPTLTVQRPRVEDMDNADIDALVDIYMFKRDRWCSGRFVERAHSYEKYCEECGAQHESSLAEALFAQLRTCHPRLVPRYSIEDILEFMLWQDKSMRACFVLNVRAAINADSSTIRAPQSEWLRLFEAMTPRLLAVAALQALGVIDAQGYVKGREEGAL